MNETTSMTMDDKERIEYIIKEMAVSNVEFSQLTGIAPATISHITGGRSKPTLPIFKSIVEAFPELNPEWVFMGQGSMYRNREEGKAAGQEVQQQPGGTLDLFSSETPADSSRRPGEGTKGRTAPVSIKPTDMSEIKDAIKSEIQEAIGRRRRQIVEVRIFFDDGTYEAFSTPGMTAGKY